MILSNVRLAMFIESTKLWVKEEFGRKRRKVANYEAPKYEAQLRCCVKLRIYGTMVHIASSEICLAV